MVEFEAENHADQPKLRKPNGDLLGDCYLTKSGLFWCKGQTTRPDGVEVSWNKFIQWMKPINHAHRT